MYMCLVEQLSWTYVVYYVLPEKWIAISGLGGKPLIIYLTLLGGVILIVATSLDYILIDFTR